MLTFLELTHRFKKLKRRATLEFCVHLDTSQIGIEGWWLRERLEMSEGQPRERSEMSEGQPRERPEMSEGQPRQRPEMSEG